MAESKSKKVIIIGAGMAGSLLALLMGRRNYDVHVYERREDTRLNPASWEGRSINLSLTTRGITAFRKAGVAETILPSCIEMTGRLMHSVSGELTYMPYGLPGQFNLSAGRQRLNEELMNEAEKSPNVHMYFNHSCKHIDIETNTIKFEYKDEKGNRVEVVESADLIVGTDGAYSEVRGAIVRKKGTDYTQEYLSHGYKELLIPPTKDGDFALPHNRLHIWPRGEFMMIALPNPDKSFTVTLFLPHQLFDRLTTEERVIEFFKQYFPDAIPIMPTYLSDFFKNPIGHLITVKVAPWHYKSSVIMGDAAHAIVPFYGQGLNASLEDVIFFDDLIEKHAGNFDIILPEFSRLRKPNGDAIAELSLRNYIEMRSKVASRLFLWRSAFEKKLHRFFPSRFIPLYSMVSYTNIPYAEVIQRDKRQSKALDRFFKFTSIASVLSIGALVAYAFAKSNNYNFSFNK